MSRPTGTATMALMRASAEKATATHSADKPWSIKCGTLNIATVLMVNIKMPKLIETFQNADVRTA